MELLLGVLDTRRGPPPLAHTGGRHALLLLLRHQGCPTRAPDQAVGLAPTEDVLPRQSSTAPDGMRCVARSSWSAPSAKFTEREFVKRGRTGRRATRPRRARTTRTSKVRSMAPLLVAPGSATGSAAFVFSGGDRAAERDAVCRVVCAAAARPGPLPSCRGGCVALVAPPPSHAVWRSIVIKCWRRLPWQFFWSSGVLC